MKKYRLAFKYREDPIVFFTLPDIDSCKMGGIEEVITQSDDLNVMKKSLERAKYYACGMNTPFIVEMD